MIAEYRLISRNICNIAQYRHSSHFRAVLRLIFLS